MAEATSGRLGKRLQRILLLLPYAIRHPGVSVDELSRKFGVNKKDLLDDLNLVFLCGLPGYGPGDLIDVTLDEDRVYVRMADYFAAPLRLTPAEALSLYAGGLALASLARGDDAEPLTRALEKLGRSIGGGPTTRPAGITVDLEAGPLQHLDIIKQALSERRRVRLEYFSASRGQLTDRVVDPWGLVAALGRWYLVAWDHPSQDERMFRVDRIRDAELLDEDANVPDDFEPERYRGAFIARGDESTIALEISPRTTSWFEEYYPVVSSKPVRGGWRRVELVTSSPRWAATLVLKLGSDVRAVAPDWVVTETRALATALAARNGFVDVAPAT